MSLAARINLKSAMEDSFSRALIYSAGAHVVLFLFFIVKAVIFPVDMDDFEPSIRVDIVDMPDKITDQVATPEPAKTPEVTEEKKAEPTSSKPEPVVKKKEPPQKVVDLTKTKAQQKEAINKLKSMSAIDKIQQDLKKNKGDSDKATTQFKGNILSAGTELKGVNRLQHENYRGDVYRHAKQNWTLPEWLANSQYRALVLVKLDERGYVIFKQITKSSGNSSYDDAVITAVSNASPFPPPPAKFKDIVAIDGITIEFVPDK
ncbi:MAG: TonB family protein [Pseudobdellovibrionaceae bacterium]